MNIIKWFEERLPIELSAPHCIKCGIPIYSDNELIEHRKICAYYPDREI